MIQAIKKIFNKNKDRNYKGFSDFFLNAPEKAKKDVITEAVRKANKDQLELFKRARLKIETH